MAYTTIGIDISDTSIKVLQLNKELEVVAYGQKIVREGIVERGFITDTEKFKEELHAVLRNTKPHAFDLETEELRTALSVPESKLYTHYIMVPNSVKRSEERAYIEAEVAQLIPHPLSELYFAYHTVENNAVRHVTFAGVPRVIIDNYAEALIAANIRPRFIGGRLFSLGRALLPDELKDDNYMIIDCGARSTDIGVYDLDAIANLTVQVPIAGSDITKALQEALGVTREEARELKKTEGLTDKRTKTYQAIESVVDLIAKEVIALRDHFNRNTGASIQHIVLAGGTALLPGLREYLEERLDIETKIGMPLEKMQNTDVIADDAHQIFFANVVGLALHSVNDKLPYINLLEQYFADTSDSLALRIRLQDIRTRNDFLVWMKYNYTHTVRQLRKIQSMFTFLRKVNVKLLASGVFLLLTLLGLIYVIVAYT